MALSTGTRLGPYEILAPIGAGGMGEVYKARDTRLNRIVAIKQSRVPFSERFEREAHAIAALNHPHICQIYDIGADYLVMEYVEGRPLIGPVSVNEALDLASQVLDALDTAHRKGITHRDLKPDNILVGKSGVKILDFGLAKLDREPESAEQAVTKPLTAEGTVLGTLQYMSPEQIEGQEADARSDIFAFGLVLYELITGQRAFEGKTRTSLVASILKDQPRPLSELAPLSPPALERVVATCLEKDPDKRWQSAREVKHALEWISTESSASTPSARFAPKRGWWLWLALAAAAIVIAAGAAYEFWPRSRPSVRVTRFQVALPEGAQIVDVNFYVRVSPDGSKLAFTTSGEKGGIWIRDLEAVDARLLAGTTEAVAPFWSPDNKSLAFGAGNKLMRVDLAGGPPQVVCESMFVVGSGFWTGDGEIVFGPRGAGLLQRVKVAGGVPLPVTARLPGETFHALPSLLPDGRHFLYLIGGMKTGVYVGSLDAKPDQQPRVKVAEAQLGATFVRSGSPAGGDLFFVREGTLMAQPFDPKAQRLTGDPIPVAQQIGVGGVNPHFSVTAGGVLAYRTGTGTKTQLTWVDRAGKILDTAGDPGQQLAIALSPDEKQVAIFRSDTRMRTAGDIWLLDLARNVETRLTTGQAGFAGGYGPVWSPNGKQLAYASGDAIYTKDAGGATDAKLVKDLGHLAQLTDWTRDGRFLIYDEGQGGPGIRELPAAGGDSIPVVTDASAEFGRISPDSHWIAYRSDRSGRSEVYVRPYAIPGSGTAPAGPVIQISRDGGTFPMWSADGSELFFANTITAAILGVKIDQSGGAFRPEAPVSLGLQLTANSPGLAITKNDQRFLLVAPLDQGARTPITVVTNWEAALKPN